MEETKQPKSKLMKYMIVMLICFGLLFGSIFLAKYLKHFIIQKIIAGLKEVETVSAMNANYSFWQPQIKASGSVRAIRGVYVTTELAGMVTKIYFTPGATVKAGDILVQLNADTEIGALKALQANAELARITYERDKKQFAINAISKQTLDSDAQNLSNILAQITEQAATVDKKTIRAPFDGRLGICLINPGQYLNTGDKITSLQTFDPIYVDFYVPQQELPRLTVGQSVKITTDSFPNQVFTGKITTIDPSLDTSTRNVQVEATVSNPEFKLIPGMFATAEVTVGQPEKYITLPQTAVAFNPYGDVIFIIKKNGTDQKGKPILIAHQVFVVTGKTRGDQIAILKGLNQGDMVVTSGQFKLRNGVQVKINNAVTPSNNPAPIVSNEHVIKA